MTATSPPIQTRSFFLIDGPNLDWAISNLLGHKPGPNDRPEFRTFAETVCAALGKQVGCKLYLTPEGGDRARHAFLATLRQPGFDWRVKMTPRRPFPQANDPGDAVAIDALRTAFSKGYRDILFVTHDHGFCPDLRSLLVAGAHVTICCFLELLHRDYDTLKPDGLQVVDLRRCEPRFGRLDPNVRTLDDLID